MNQDLHSRSPDGVEGAEDVQGVGGTEPEDGLAFVQDDEGLWTESHFRQGGSPRSLTGRELLGGRCGLRGLKLWQRGRVRGRGDGLTGSGGGYRELAGHPWLGWDKSKFRGLSGCIDLDFISMKGPFMILAELLSWGPGPS